MNSYDKLKFNIIVFGEGKSEAVDGNILGRADFELSKYLFGIEVETFEFLVRDLKPQIRMEVLGILTEIALRAVKMLVVRQKRYLGVDKQRVC